MLKSHNQLMGRARWLAEQLGLDDEERHEIAMMLSSRFTDPVSWGVLNDSELILLCAWLRGALYIEELKQLRG